MQCASVPAKLVDHALQPGAAFALEYEDEDGFMMAMGGGSAPEGPRHRRQLFARQPLHAVEGPEREEAQG